VAQRVDICKSRTSSGAVSDAVESSMFMADEERKVKKTGN
jgi:hypothetical protein